MIKNTTYRWAMGLCALLLVAAALPLSARDAALPPGADFQEGIQGSNIHPRQKRSLRGWIKGAATIMARSYRLIQARRIRRISVKLYEKGSLFCKHADTRLALSPTCKDPRMTDRVVLNIINKGLPYLDKRNHRIVFLLPDDGGVIMANPQKDNVPLGTVITLLTHQIVAKKLHNNDYVF